MQTIFENKTTLSKLDIIFQSLFILAFLVSIYLIGPILKPNFNISDNFIATTFLGFVFLGLLLLKSIREQTIIRIDIDELSNDLIIVIQRHFKGYAKIRFNANLEYKIETVPSRSTPPIKVLFISDGENSLEMSNRHKGVDTETLEAILTALKVHYPKTHSTEVR